LEKRAEQVLQQENKKIYCLIFCKVVAPIRPQNGKIEGRVSEKSKGRTGTEN
jgi:hypothetical protein